MSQVKNQLYRQGLSTDRRQFLKLLGVAGGGLVLGVPLLSQAGETYPNARKDAWQADAFIQVTEQGQVRLLMPQAEMGQGVTMGFATLLAEELDMSPALIEVTVAGVHKAYNMPGPNFQITGGSASMRERYILLRESAAKVRSLILQAAAKQWQAPFEELQLADGVVRWNDKQEPLKNFVALAATLPVPESVTLKSSADFRWIGQDRTPRIDALAKVTGTAEFGLDVEITGLKRAAVKHCSVIGGKVKSFKTNDAENMPGVHQIFSIGNAVAVVAEHYWQARNAIKQISVEWELPELAKLSSDAIEQNLSAGLEEEGEEAFIQGEGNKTLDNAANSLQGRYYAPYLAHATMEPMNCVVHLQGDHAEIWVGTQAPGLAQELVSEFSGIKRDNIRVNTTFLGGGFGRRGFHDYVAQATSIAKISGQPIQLVWNREDDTQNGYYRPVSMVDLQAGLDAEGQLQTWSVKRAGPNILPYMFDEAMGAIMPEFIPQSIVEWASKRGYGIFDGWSIDPSSVEGLYESYSVPNKEVRHVTVDPGLRCGFWRSVGHSFSGFFAESFMDELAHASGQDPLEFRLRHLGDNPRLKQVLELAARSAGWGQPKPGRHLGLAAVKSFETYVAEVAEVSLENNRLRVHKVVCAVDCGQAVNPDMVRTQMESGIIYGLTAALHSEITLKNGAVTQSNFHDYPMFRMQESPEIEVHLIDSNEPPTGVGEPGLPPIAPAVANAIFAATGKRLRRLPLKVES